MIIAEYYDGKTRIRIHDDYIPTDKEILQEKQKKFLEMCQKMVIDSIREAYKKP